jgi:hypothetical protein
LYKIGRLLFERVSRPSTMALPPPPLPPLVADQDAQIALNIEVYDPAAPPLVRVSRSSKRLKIADSLLTIGAITEAEHGRHITFEASCIRDALGLAADGGVPGGGGHDGGQAAIVEQLNTITTNLTNLTNTVNAMRDEQVIMRNEQVIMRNEQVNIAVRQFNAVASFPTDPLRNLTDVAGNLCPNFPLTLHDLNGATGPQLTNFLNHYGLAVPHQKKDKLERLKKFIGIRIG